MGVGPKNTCLNPCFSGLYSLTKNDKEMVEAGISLNPCFSGLYSLTSYEHNRIFKKTVVLILVLVDFTL